MLTLLVALGRATGAQQTSTTTLETNETIFSVLTALNLCGYDQELSVSEPVRLQIRSDVAHALQTSPQAAATTRELCTFYREHRMPDDSRELSQYVSLALFVGEPPKFELTTPEADLPPDASYVLGMLPYLRRFYHDAGLHDIWNSHHFQYQSYIEQNHDPVSQLLLTTDLYLRNPLTGSQGRRFVIYVEPMGAPGQTNARNYGVDYFMVTSPEHGRLQLDRIRHVYLQYTLDWLAGRSSFSMNTLNPLLDLIQSAPLDPSYKQDVSLLVNESLARAIEIRLEPGKGKEAEAAREIEARKAASEGFILTPYFQERLKQLEKNPASLQDVYSGWLREVDLARQKKIAAGIQFTSAATAEVLRASKPRGSPLLDTAEKRLAAGDFEQAGALAQQALDGKIEDPGRALFVLAQVAAMNKDITGAKGYFERALQVAHEPRLIAWSHIYLARIYDLQEQRDAALAHYRAALAAGDPAPAIKTAAERGLERPYEPPARPSKSDEPKE